MPAGREGEVPPLPGVVVVRLPLGFYSTPAPEGVPGLHSMPVADWVDPYPIDTELAMRNFHSATEYWRGLLDELPPIFPPL